MGTVGGLLSRLQVALEAQTLSKHLLVSVATLVSFGHLLDNLSEFLNHLLARQLGVSLARINARSECLGGLHVVDDTGPSWLGLGLTVVYGANSLKRKLLRLLVMLHLDLVPSAQEGVGVGGRCWHGLI